MRFPSLYSMCSLDDLLRSEAPSYARMILAAGEDRRAYEAVRALLRGTTAIEQILVVDYQERIPELGTQDWQVYRAYEGIVDSPEVIECSIHDPSGCLRAIGKLGKEQSQVSGMKIAVDISCFTKPYFFALLKKLIVIDEVREIDVFYTEPMSYVAGEQAGKAYHSTQGALRVIEIPGFPGLDESTDRKVLVVLLGFDGELATFLSEEVAPDEIVIVNGFPGYYPTFKDISAINNEKLIAGSGSQAGIRYACANNPFDTFNLLCAIEEESSGSFMNIAALGTKPMALGACLFAVFNPRVRAVYPLPERYVKTVSEECSRSWCYRIKLT